MSFGISCNKNGSYIGSVRVGTNTSQEALLALLLAAYGISSFPESARVRSRWIEPSHRELQRSDIKGPTGPFVPIDTIRDWKKWIAFNENDCTWIKMENATINHGLKLKPVKDASLILLLRFREEAQKEREAGSLSAKEVSQLASLLRRLMPKLQESCWCDKIESVTQLFEKAVLEGACITMG